MQDNKTKKKYMCPQYKEHMFKTNTLVLLGSVQVTVGATLNGMGEQETFDDCTGGASLGSMGAAESLSDGFGGSTLGSMGAPESLD